MIYAKRITDGSWFIENSKQERLGLLSLKNSVYTVIYNNKPYMNLSLVEVQTLLGSKVEFQDRVQNQTTHKEIDGFPVQHEVTNDIVHREDGVIEYTSKQKDKKFYAGYWCTPSGTNTYLWYVRISLSEQIYNNYVQQGITPKGPYKDKMEALFGVKQGETYCKDNSIVLE